MKVNGVGEIDKICRHVGCEEPATTTFEQFLVMAGPAGADTKPSGHRCIVIGLCREHLDWIMEYPKHTTRAS